MRLILGHVFINQEHVGRFYTLPIITFKASLFVKMSNSTGLTGLKPFPHGNVTLINNNDLCILALCDLTLAHFDYLPSLGGNALYATIFGACFFTQLVLGIKYRTWGFMAATTIGMLTEIIGYVARLMMNSNPFTKSNFLMYLVTLTIAPAFLSAAIYLCLARIVVVYGEERSRFRPRTYTILFCSCDFLALLLQAIGGAIASIATTVSAVSTTACRPHNHPLQLRY